MSATSTGTGYGINNAGTVYVEGGTIRSAFTGIYNATSGQGKLEISDGLVEATGGNYCYAVDNYSGTLIVKEDAIIKNTSNIGLNIQGGTVTISGGAIIGADDGANHYGIRMVSGDGTSELTISGGEITGGKGIYYDRGTLNVRGGTFNGTTYAIHNKANTLNLSGNPVLNGTSADIYLHSDPTTALLAISDEITGSGPYTVEVYLNAVGAISTAYATADYSAMFESVKNDYMIGYNSQQKLVYQTCVTVTPTAAQSKVYGANDPASFDYSLSHDITVTGALSRVAGEAAGTYSYQLGGLASTDDDYGLKLASSPVFTITPKPITVVPKDVTWVKGEPEPTFELELADGSTMERGDAFSAAIVGTPTFVCSATASSPAGTYPITISDMTTVLGNYTVNYEGAASVGTLTVIEPFDLTDSDYVITPSGYETGTWTNQTITVKPNPAGDYTKIRRIVSGTKGAWTTELTFMNQTESLTFELGTENGIPTVSKTLSLKSDTVAPVSTVPVENLNGETGERTVALTLSDDAASDNGDTPGLLSGIDVSSVTLKQGSTDCTDLISASLEVGLTYDKLNLTFDRENASDYTLAYSDNAGNQSTTTISMSADTYQLSFAGGTNSKSESPTGTAPADQTLWEGKKITLPAHQYSFSGNHFLGWKESSTGTVYQAGAAYTMPGRVVTFTATWAVGDVKYETTTNNWAYGTWAEALAGVMPGGRMILSTDITADAMIDLTKSVTLMTDGTARTLNMGNNTLRVSGTDTTLIVNDSKLTISGSISGSTTGTIYISGNASVLTLQVGTISNTAGNGIFNAGSDTVNINGGIVSSSGSGIRNFGGGTINIGGGTIQGSGYGIENIQSGTINMDDGTISTAAAGIMNMKDGPVTINGGTISSSSSDGISNSAGTININDGSISAYGYGIYNSTGTVNIADGSVSSTSKSGLYNKTAGSGGSFVISGGSISGETYAVSSYHNMISLSGAPTLEGETADIYLENTQALLSFPAALNGAGTYTVATNANSAGKVLSEEYTADYSDRFISADTGYRISYNSANKLFLQQVVTITPTAGQSKVYGENDPVFTYTQSPEASVTGIGALSGALGRETGSDVGTYAYTLGNLAAPSVNYYLVLSSSATKFTINQNVVTIPEVADKTYNGSEQGHGLSNSAYTISVESGDTASATNVGTYKVTATLNDTTNMVWSDDTTAAKSIEWKIVPKQVVIPTIADRTYNGESIAHGLANADGYTISIEDDDKASATDAGTYHVTATLTSTANYIWSGGSTTAKSIQWKILPISITVVPEDVSRKVGESNNFTLALALGSSLADGDTLTSAAGTPTFASTATGDVPGNYNITITQLVGGSANYTVTFTGSNSTGTLNVTQDAIAPGDYTISPTGYEAGTWATQAITVTPVVPYTKIRSVAANGYRSVWQNTLTVSNQSLDLTFELQTATGAISEPLPQALSLKSDTVVPTASNVIESVNAGTGIMSVSVTLSDEVNGNLLSGIDTASIQLKQGSTDCDFTLNAGTIVGGIQKDITVTFTRTNTQDYTLTFSDEAGNAGADKIIALGKSTKALTYTSGANGTIGSPTGTTPSSVSLWEYQQVTLPANPFTLEGYTFQGWKATIGETQIIYQPGDIFTMQAADVTMTAIWGLTEVEFETARDVWAQGSFSYAFDNRMGVMAGGKIRLLRDVTAEATTISKSVTLQTDGSARTLNMGTGSLIVSGSNTILTIDDVNLTITGSSVDADQGATIKINSSTSEILLKAGSVKSTSAAALLVTMGKASLSGAVIASTSGNGVELRGGDITISGGTVTGGEVGVRNTSGTVTISGGTITGGDVGVSITTGWITMTNGTIIGGTYGVTLAAGQTFALSGAPVLTGTTADIYLYGDSSKLSFPAALTGEGTYTLAFASPSAGRELSDEYNTDYSDKFVITDSTYQIGYNSSKKLFLQKYAAITPDSGQSKAYGDDDPVYTYKAYVDGVVTEPSAIGITGALGRAAGENVGTYGYELGTLASRGSNYIFILSSTPRFAITKRAITVVPEDASRIAGEDNPVFTMKLSDGSTLANADVLSYGVNALVYAAGTPTFACTADAESEAGDYDITITGLEGGSTNYSVTFTGAAATGTLTVLPIYTLSYGAGEVTFDPPGNAPGKAPTVLIPEGITPGSIKLPTGRTVTLPANPFTLEGYIFCGWEYKGKLYAPGDSFIMPNTDAQLTATWVSNQTADASGEVIFQNGKQVTHAILNLYQEGQLIQQTESNGSGKFKFKKLTNQAYDLEIVIEDKEAGDQIQTYRIITKDGSLISGDNSNEISQLVVSQPQAVIDFSRQVNNLLPDWDGQEMKQCWEGSDEAAKAALEALVEGIHFETIAVSDIYYQHLSEVQTYQLFEDIRDKWAQLLAIAGKVTLTLQDDSTLANVEGIDALIGLLITKEDLETKKPNEKIQIIFQIKDVDQNIEDPAILESMALLIVRGGQNQKVTKFFEVTIQKQIGDNPAVSISETPKEVELMFWIPEDMRDGDDYRILRNHEFEVEALRTRRIGNYLYAYSSQFSTYAIAYTPNAVQGGGDGGNGQTGQDAPSINAPIHIPSPKTGQRPPVTANSWMAIPAITGCRRRKLYAPAPRRRTLTAAR